MSYRIQCPRDSGMGVQIHRKTQYIESWYNGERIHSSIEYMAPVEFERKYIQLNGDSAS